MKNIPLIATAVTTLALASSARAQTAAVPSAELADPAGDVHEFNGPGNSRDLVKLSLGSDGKDLLVGATLHQEDRGKMAGAVVELYLDTDNNPSTGGKAEEGPGGFEYRAELAVCLKGKTSTSCSGGEDAPQLRHAGVLVERFKGAAGEEMKWGTLEMVVSHMESPQVPLQGRVIQDRVAYRSLGLKAGQAVRIVVREADAKVRKDGFLPPVVLKLK